MNLFFTFLILFINNSLSNYCNANIINYSQRNIKIIGQNWVDTKTGKNILLKGPNVVVKGPPWLPKVEGKEICNDTNNITCKTFNEADAIHITKTMGWNTIRLGVTWAGAQPKDTNSLDPIWVSNLQKILTLCNKYGIHVILDHHTDMVGSADCGFGVPIWFSKKAAPELIGKELETAFPFSYLGKFTSMFKINKPKHCINNADAWLEHSGDDNYNLLNNCCISLNSGANNNALGFSKLSQKTLDYLFEKGPGRDDFCRYHKLLAEAVFDYPSAIAIELMNEPVYIKRWNMYETWRVCNNEITSVIPDMSVSVIDIGEGAVIPEWVNWIDSGIAIYPSTVEWLKKSTNLFYAWHWYGDPKDPLVAIKNVKEIQNKWNMPSMLTETMSCSVINAAENADISWNYWHYSQYCDTNKKNGGKIPPESFGACILGWGDGISNKKC